MHSVLLDDLDNVNGRRLQIILLFGLLLLGWMWSIQPTRNITRDVHSVISELKKIAKKYLIFWQFFQAAIDMVFFPAIQNSQAPKISKIDRIFQEYHIVKVKGHLKSSKPLKFPPGELAAWIKCLKDYKAL